MSDAAWGSLASILVSVAGMIVLWLKTQMAEKEAKAAKEAGEVTAVQGAKTAATVEVIHTNTNSNQDKQEARMKTMETVIENLHEEIRKLNDAAKIQAATDRKEAADRSPP